MNRSVSFGRRTVTAAAMSDRRRPRLLGHVVTACAAISLLGLGGCSYLGALQASMPTPDSRVQLGWQDAVSLTARQLPNYTCAANYLLTCERGGSVTYECTCVLR